MGWRIIAWYQAKISTVSLALSTVLSHCRPTDAIPTLASHRHLPQEKVDMPFTKPHLAFPSHDILSWQCSLSAQQTPFVHAVVVNTLL